VKKRGTTLINVALALALVGCSLWLVNRAQERSRSFDALARAGKVQLQLDAEYARLEAERDTVAADDKVSKVATKRLKMSRPVQTVYIDAPPTELAGQNAPVPARTPAPARAADSMAPQGVAQANTNANTTANNSTQKPGVQR
jgi:cell division protein FtsL